MEPLILSKSNPTILVFKTNIRLQEDVHQVEQVLNSLPGIMQWNVDRHDADNVLRIVSHSLQPQAVIETIRAAGYCCEELND
jgi:hypothetical protein